MLSSRSRKRSKPKKQPVRQQPTPPSQDEDIVLPDFEQHDDVEMEKDETEKELERLVFGDTAGFREGIRSFQQHDEGKRDADVDANAPEEHGNEEIGLEGVSDADLFYFDAGPSNIESQALVSLPDDGASEDETYGGRGVPAWEDSDDERITVSLASVPRLRKLRNFEGEDMVNGKEYIRRLRRQYQLLHPMPDWVNDARRPARKRRRRDTDVDASSGEDSSSVDDEDEQLSTQPLAKLLRNADALIRPAPQYGGKKRKFKPEVIDIQRTKDVAGAQPSAITSLTFHPTLPLLLSSGPSSRLSLHHVQPTPAPGTSTPNPLLTTLTLLHTPLTTTAFHPTTPRIFLSARRRYFHIWDLSTGKVEKITRVYGQQEEQQSMERFRISPCGHWIALLGSARKGGGVVNIVDAGTLQWIQQARIESKGGIAEIAWWSDGNGLAIVGKNGEVSEWSVAEQRVVARWQDEGAVGITTLALGGKSGREGWLGGDRWVAVGSTSGIVNVYDRRAWMDGVTSSSSSGSTATTISTAHANKNHTTAADNGGVPSQPHPTRTLSNLTTPISHLAFSPDGQLLAMSSRWKRDALRLVHLPSCTVYRNWPTSATPLGRITALAFGYAGGGGGGDRRDGGKDEGEGELVLAVANEQGKIRLWEIRA